MTFSYKENKLFYDGHEIFQADAEIQQVVEIKDKCIVLHDWVKKLKGKAQSNVVCIDQLGHIMWLIPPAPLGGNGQTDCYADLFWNSENLKVSSWSCFSFTLNPDTGELSEKVFTK